MGDDFFEVHLDYLNYSTTIDLISFSVVYYTFRYHTVITSLLCKVFQLIFNYFLLHNNLIKQ